MTWKDDLPVAYRDHGLTVVERGGWQNFGVGDWTYGIPKACLNHQFVVHETTPDSACVDMLCNGYNTGSYFLNPPVANTFLGLPRYDPQGLGIIYLLAGRVAQHAGRGVSTVFNRAMQDLPPVGDGQNAPSGDDWDGGSFCYWGREMHHYNEEPFEQYEALVRVTTAECEVFGWSENRQLEHSNATQRKYTDLISLDGNQLRRDIAARLGGVKPVEWNILDWISIPSVV